MVLHVKDGQLADVYAACIRCSSDVIPHGRRRIGARREEWGRNDDDVVPERSDRQFRPYMGLALDTAIQTPDPHSIM